MANVVHRTTFEVLYSVNTPDYPPAVWVINPANLTALVGNGSPMNPQVPKLYWVIDPPGSTGLREMTAPEKSVVDQANGPLNQAKSQRKEELVAGAQQFIDSRYPEEHQRRLQTLKQSATGQALASLNMYYNWQRSVFSGLKGQMNMIDSATSIPEVQAVGFDVSPYVQTDPQLSLVAAI